MNAIAHIRNMHFMVLYEYTIFHVYIDIHTYLNITYIQIFKYIRNKYSNFDNSRYQNIMNI